MASVTGQSLSKESLLTLASKAARAAGGLLNDKFSLNAGSQSNAGKDLKTVADVETEALVRKYLEPTGIQILGEESAAGPQLDRAAPCWIVDPLDGTLNFTRGFSVCCVSIAYCEGLRPLVGVIYDFQADILYSGIVGQGATANDSPVTVSAVDEKGQAVLATGFPAGRDYADEPLLNFIQRVQGFKKIRMIGSAALSLAHVAAGHFDAYFEESIWWWDVAAGLALVEAAGGCHAVGAIGQDWKADVRAWNRRLPANF